MSPAPNRPLDAVAEYVTVGYVGPSTEFFCNEGVPFLRTGNVGTREIIWSNLKQVVPKFHSKQKKSALKTGDVVVSRVISNEVNAAVVPPELDGANCGNVLVIRPGHRLHPEYLVHLIGCPASQRALLGRQVGSAQAVINTSVLKAWHVPVLPLAEQRRIAEVLDRAEALRAKRRAALAQLDELTQAIFLDMFGDPMSNPKGVKVVRLADVSNRITDGVHQKPNYTDSGVAFISVKDITTGKLVFDDCKYISAEDHEKFTRRCKPERNDILYTKVGATYGRPAIVDTDREFSLYVSVCIIKPKRDLIDPHFLNAALGTSAVKGQADRRIKGIGVPDLHLDQIQSFLIPLPSMSEQHEFARRVTAVETLKTAHRASLAELDALFASLQHRAFRGEL